MNFVYERLSHIGQPMSKNYKSLFSEFSKKIVKSRKFLKIFDNNNLSSLINMDETPIYMDMTDKRVWKILKLLYQAISADWFKLPRALIFRAKKNGKLEDY